MSCTVRLRNAALHSLTRAQAVEMLKANPDHLAQWRGAAIETDVVRVSRLARQKETFEIGGPLTRAACLIENFDGSTVARAIGDYEPAIPLSVEAFIISGIALIVGWTTTHLFAWSISRRLRRRDNLIRIPEPMLES
jgi:Protein of unknown function (DUF2937)